MKETSNHISVLKNEVSKYLNIKQGGIYVDLTLGGGGHSLDMLRNLINGTLIAFDLDLRAIGRFRAKLESEYEGQCELRGDEGNRMISLTINSNKVVLINDNFTNLTKYLRLLEIEQVDGILADLGWSSDQLDEIKGLSFEKNEDELDMRFDRDSQVSASDLLNGLGKRELMMLFKKYADFSDHEARKLTKAIIEERTSVGLTKVGELNRVVESTFKNIKGRSGENINQTKSRIYQAFRIAVNNELENLQNLIELANVSLKKNGVFLLITFHSGEHRIAKEEFGTLIGRGELKYISKVNGKNYISPDLEELKLNIRSRSAKLWVLEKLK